MEMSPIFHAFFREFVLLFRHDVDARRKSIS